MRIAPWLSKIAIFGIGIAIGALTVVCIRSTPAFPISTSAAQAESRAPTLNGSSPELASNLLKVVGRNLIADNRATRSPDGPILFFAKPKPYGEALCRVDVYTVAAKVVRGQVAEKEKWTDDLEVETQYGLWKRPSDPRGNRDKACSEYRDFEHLISEGSVLSVARATFVMEEILRQAKRGSFGFPVTCNRYAHDANMSRTSCDPVAVLRRLTLQDLYHAENKSEVQSDRSYLRKDEVLVSGDELKTALGIGKHSTVAIKVEDEQHFGRQSVDEADVRSVGIEIFEGH